jgi:hypothetical protein
MNPDQDLQRRVAELTRGLQATEQALSDERFAGRNDAIIAVPARAFAASWPAGAEYETKGPLRDLLVAHRATTPSPTPATHVVVAVDDLKKVRRLAKEGLAGSAVAVLDRLIGGKP